MLSSGCLSGNMENKPNGVRLSLSASLSRPSYGSEGLHTDSRCSCVLLLLQKPAPIKSINGIPVKSKDPSPSTFSKVKPNHTLIDA
jgi:hypothetical protein